MGTFRIKNNAYNGYFFDLQTRAFGSLWFDFGEFVRAVVMGLLLDWMLIGLRRRRAFVGWIVLFVLLNALFISGGFPVR